MADVLYWLAAVFFFVYVHGDDKPGPVVNTRFGKVQGKYIGDIAVFTSIPYADKIDGNNRWRDPRFPSPWPGILDAVETSPGCPQECDLPSPKYTCPSKQDENCLFLNIYAPKDAKMLPVMVYFHGGDFIQGFSGSKLYDGRFLVNKTNIIVVTVNYRLHALGYLVYGSGDRAITGNYGLKDQILSLEWVQSNIMFFGGDPGRVTVGGQSAGAISTSVLLNSVQASGLFHQIIVESNPVGVPLKSMKDATKLGNDFAKALGCGPTNDFECLYSKNFTEVTRAAMAVDSKIVDYFHFFDTFLQWSPVIDGKEVLDQTLLLFEKGIHPNMPVLIGTTTNEGVIFVHEAISGKIKETEYDAILLGLFGLHYTKVHDMYPPVDKDNSFRASVMLTDRIFICPTRHAAQLYSNQTANLHMAPVFLYLFNQSWSFAEAWQPGFGYCANYSCHSAELPYLFGTVSLAGYNFTDDEAKLSDSMMHYWGNFVKYGNPNGDFSKQGDVVSWPKYMSLDGWQMMKLKAPDNEVVKDYRQHFCNVWDELGYDLN